MININREIARLVEYGVQHSLLHKEDVAYATNRILAVLGLNDYSPEEVQAENLRYPAPILENILEWSAENGRLESNTPVYRDLLDTELMTCLMPRPSEIISQFRSLYHVDKKAATDYYYKLSRDSNYIRVDRIEKDEMWVTPTRYGDIVITINLSKPEKDPKAIAAARNMPSATYPKCLLCRETEGYKGNVSQPPRGNHRLIPLTLGNEQWYLQYSPYVYYNEHCILLNSKHTPMKVSRKSFERLLEFIEFLPHYFVGSNADLPIVGGSILSHDHFQGGNYEFPMAKAKINQPITLKGYEDITAGLVDWPMSVIRLAGTDKKKLCDIADKILTLWRAYSDESAEILAFTGDTPHNTITPIARFRDGKFELDLVLRNNRTTEEHPLGLFHPHAEYHHIKKENIGLIEVMGLAILPARLKTELAKIQDCLLHPEKEAELLADESLKVHAEWYYTLKELHPTEQNVKHIIQQSIGEIFSKILENAGVYKTDEAGRAAFLRFIDHVNAN